MNSVKALPMVHLYTENRALKNFIIWLIAEQICGIIECGINHVMIIISAFSEFAQICATALVVHLRLL